jgi:hypothetical protein
MTAYISSVVEGVVDAAVVRRLLGHAGLETRVYVRDGKQNVRSRIGGYNAASRQIPFLVLVDLDDDYDCAPALIADWLPDREPGLWFRVAVRAIEAWLLGDRQRLASFLRVKQSAIREDPEALDNPKRAVVDIARSSSSGDIRFDMVPRPGSGRAVGPAYTSRLIEYATNMWRPEVAAESCDSLRRVLNALGAHP